MEQPIRFSKNISGNYKMEVDVTRDDCLREPAHWHLYDGGWRIAQVWVDSCMFEREPDVARYVKEEALRLTSMYASEIKDAYRHNAKYGAIR